MAEHDYYTEMIKGLRYQHNSYYGLSYLTRKEFNKAVVCFSMMRKDGVIDGIEYHSLVRIFKHQHDNHAKIKELIYQAPRRHAQLFIGKKKIREFIFKRDNYKCLCCGSDKKLSIDHIHSVHLGGENKISNLQTLCKSCNSSKGTNFYDYR